MSRHYTFRLPYPWNPAPYDVDDHRAALREHVQRRIVRLSHAPPGAEQVPDPGLVYHVHARTSHWLLGEILDAKAEGCTVGVRWAEGIHARKTRRAIEVEAATENALYDAIRRCAGAEGEP